MSEAITGDRNPVIALILNIIPFGVGYFYIGQWIKGLIQAGLLLTGLGWITWIITWFDGYFQASILKDGGAIGQFSFFSTPVKGLTQPPPIPNQQQYSSSTSEHKKVCLSCGQMVDVRYSICPYCKSSTSGGEKKESGTVEY